MDYQSTIPRFGVVAMLGPTIVLRLFWMYCLGLERKVIVEQHLVGTMFWLPKRE
jgi:hypothetical protein